MNFDIEDLSTPTTCYFNGTIKVFSFLWRGRCLEPQENIRIRLFKEGESCAVREGRTNCQGEIVFEGLEKGIYNVKADVNQQRFLPPIYKPSSRVRTWNLEIYFRR
ncbi:hypothetical protein [Clostridium polynesiense]|uniref:hypothetical protein n=1 Tax=Clostridium polynesiense TaxID=1325933 RepID=UPI00058EE076|nr:hypothetical protein [Clostridium polynesiense]